MTTTKQPEMNCNNRTVFIGDNREVMLGLNADIADAIITDPPFNKEQVRKDSSVKIDKEKSTQTRLVDIHGNVVQAYSDKWKIEDITGDELQYIRYKDKDLIDFCSIVGRSHSSGMEAYLLFMADRLLLCHEILKETGSIFLHCDHSSNGYLRMLMDAIFGEKNFRNEIIWCYGKWSNTAKCFQRNTDTILFYAKNAELMKFNVLREFSDDKKKKIEKGYCTNTVRNAKSPSGRIRQLIVYDREKAASVIKKGNYDNVVYVDGQGSPMRNWWHIPHLNSQAKERCKEGGKWTDQKPVSLYTRLVKAVTDKDKGDLVIDPFCGCATTLIAAENAQRKWIGIDINPTTEELVIEQLAKLSEGTEDFWRGKVKIRHGLPKRSDNRISKKKLDEFKDQLIVQQMKIRSYLICVICEHPKDSFDLEVGHKQPKCEDGEWEVENLQLECPRCNRRKGSTKTAEDVRKELKKEGLLYQQRVKVHEHLKTLTPRQKDWKKGIKQRKKPRWKEDLEREKESRQTKLM